MNLERCRDPRLADARLARDRYQSARRALSSLPFGNQQRFYSSVLNQKFLSTLGVDGDRAVTKPFDGGQDVVGGFGPAKGLGVGIAGVDVGGDSGLQRGGRAVGAALDLLVGEQRKEALDLVDP